MRPRLKITIEQWAFLAISYALAAGYGILLWKQPAFMPWGLRYGSSWHNGVKVLREHPIDVLMRDAEKKFKDVLKEQPKDLAAAGRAYRERRHRHPPPGFDQWVKEALELDALIPERYFDRIYHDLQPFWGMEPKLLRFQAYAFPHVIRASSLEDIAEHLPDMDIPVNVMQHPRLAVPWETMADMVKEELEIQDKKTDPKKVITAYTNLKDFPPISPKEIKQSQTYVHNWVTTTSGHDLISDVKLYWLHYQKTCPPDTPGRDADLFNLDDRIMYPKEPNEYYTKDGYIFNATMAKDPCLQPLMRAMHGAFVEPLGLSSSGDLMPIFSGSKLPGNNDIVWPGATYYSQDDITIGKDIKMWDWDKKENKVFWQGRATGGINRDMTWWRLPRHRWAQMTNGTTVDASINFYKIDSPSFDLPLWADFKEMYPEAHTNHPNTWKSWLERITQIRVVDLVCTPEQKSPTGLHLGTCPYSSRLIGVKDAILPHSFYERKVVADIDGDSYSPYLASIVRSTSMPLKATMYAEWHDDRLVPWFHYVPMDNSFIDLFGILDYFITDEDDRLPDRDNATEKIAKNGMAWSERMLRTSDMRLYTWRLLLEYARVVDPYRDKLGYVDDIFDRAKKNQRDGEEV
ncbi:hypothetical protein SEUCBS139899_002266 [Sporothrix eucalyptigena]